MGVAHHIRQSAGSDRIGLATLVTPLIRTPILPPPSPQLSVAKPLQERKTSQV